MRPDSHLDHEDEKLGEILEFEKLEDVSDPQVARDIGLISDGVWKKIEAALDKDLRDEIVKKRMALEGIPDESVSSQKLSWKWRGRVEVDKVRKRKALAGAFSMYKRFILEEPDSDLAKRTVGADSVKINGTPVPFKAFESVEFLSTGDIDKDKASPEAKTALMYLARMKAIKIQEFRKEPHNMSLADAETEADKHIDEFYSRFASQHLSSKDEKKSVEDERFSEVRETFSEVNEKSLSDLWGKIVSRNPDTTKTVDLTITTDETEIRRKEDDYKRLDEEYKRISTLTGTGKSGTSTGLVYSSSDRTKAKKAADDARYELRKLQDTHSYRENAKALREQLLKICDSYEKAFGDGLFKYKRGMLSKRFLKLHIKNLKGINFNDNDEHKTLKEAYDAVFEDLPKRRKFIEAESVQPDESYAAKTLIKAILKEQDPRMPDRRLDQRASLILVENVSVLQSQKNYAELAKEAGPEKLKANHLLNLKHRLIDLKYKIYVEDKVHSPFGELEVEDFEDLNKLGMLFRSGRLNLENGFFVLAALAATEKEGLKGERSGQSIKVEKELKRLLAKELGVEDRLHEAKVSKLIDEAFEERLYDAEGAQQECSQKSRRTLKKWKDSKKKELQLRYKVMKEQLRTGEIEVDKFDMEYDKLMEEMESHGLKKIFWLPKNKFVSKWWNRPAAQWLRDQGRNKSLGALRLAARGIWGGIKAPFQTVRAIVSWPLYLAGNLSLGLYNCFSKVDWKPIPMFHQKMWEDLKRPFGVPKKMGEAIKKDWQWSAQPGRTYAGRTKMNVGQLEEVVKEYQRFDDKNAMVLRASPFGDMESHLNYYKEKLKKI